jgi:hypothetical protein
MKIFINYSDYSSANRVKREPLFEISEIADRLKIDETDLRSKMKGKRREGYPPPPKPAIPRRVAHVGNRPQLYKLSEFKKWLKELNEFNEGVAPL